MSELNAEELVRFDRPGPRYTSYPTVPAWKGVGVEDRTRALMHVSDPAQVYVHIPFCAEQCSFCGCNMAVAGRQSAGDTYLDLLEKQIEALPLPSRTIHVQRIHLGGGTPTWLNPGQLDRLGEMLRLRFHPVEGAELSLEADPQITTTEQLDVLDRHGFNRLSLGVQSFTPQVLEAVNRPQLTERIPALLEHCRTLGWWGLNLDLMYGLPEQTPERFEQDLHAAIALQPDRLAVFGYAHVPWLKRHQQTLDAGAMPGVEDRARCLLLAQEILQRNGYQALGFDHFARPDDDLSRAARAGTLHRNFMGYTTLSDVDLIGLGMSAISEVQGTYWQDEPHLGKWMKAMRKGEDLLHRGHVLTDEDRARQFVINELMCNLRIDDALLSERFGRTLRGDFASELKALQPMVRDGLVQITEDAITVTDKGRLLVRLVAMPFDAYLPPQRASDRFSRTV